MIINEKLLYIEYLNGNDKELLNKIEGKILNIYYNDLKIEQNLLFLAKAIFMTCIINNNNFEIINKYKKILEIINKSFKEEEIEEFKKSIITLKNRYEVIYNPISEEEKEEIEINIKNTFAPFDENISDFENTRNFIENNIKYSSIIKKYITLEKEKNPDNYIDIDKTLNDYEEVSKNLGSMDNNNFILSLLGKCIEKNGTEIVISKNKDEKFKDIELSSLQSLFSLGNQKKYELHFDFGDEINKKILNNSKEKEEFLKEWKLKIAKKLEINEDKLIFTDVHSGSLAVHAAIVDPTLENEKAMIGLQNEYKIKKIEEKPMLEILKISPEILDKRGNRHENWGINEMRGGEKYIPPVNGWYGIGLKVQDKYDNGNNDWLGSKNKRGEYAVAYIRLHNLYNDKEKMIEDLGNMSQKVDMIENKLYRDEPNLKPVSLTRRVIGGVGTILSIPLAIFNLPMGLALFAGSQLIYQVSNKCGDGVCVFQNPEYAENSAGFIDILGFRVKIILMCRVNPKKIRQPKNFPECWILNPNEIRPYRILVKKIPISPLTGAINDKIITSKTPIDYIVDAIKSNNFSFSNLAKDKKFEKFSLDNGQKLKDDFFAIKLYTSVYFGFINQYLRERTVLKDFRGFSGFTEQQLNSWICCLHLALSRNKNVKDDTIVYRGIKQYKFSSEVGIGSKFYFREFLSTSIKKEISENFIEKNGTLMIIKIKNNGTNGHPNYCCYIEDITYTKDQYEVLISSHCYFTVTKIIRKEQIDYVYLICEAYLID